MRKFTKPLVGIIVPIYLEQETIEKTIRAIEKNVRTSHFVYLIYDDVNDPTVKVVKKISNNYPRIKLVKNRFNRGAVNALKTGFVVAKEELLVPVMGDLCDDTRDIDKMVSLIHSGYDLVCASRYSYGGKRVNGPIIKGVLSFFACQSLYYLIGFPTKDATNSFKCYKRKFVTSIKIESKGGFELPLELTVKAYAKKLRITEIPTVWKEREKGKSKFKLLRWLPQYLRWYLFAIGAKLGLN